MFPGCTEKDSRMKFVYQDREYNLKNILYSKRWFVKHPYFLISRITPDGYHGEIHWIKR